MPQIFHFQDSEYQLGIWKIEEPEDFFIGWVSAFGL